MDTYDIAIIGGGPAGVTAALYASRAGKKAVLFERMFIGGQVAVTPHVKNYPGGSSSDGMQIAATMKAQIEETVTEVRTEQVTSFEKDGPDHVIVTSKGRYRAACVILAMGAPARRLGIPGEEEYANRGVSYCAVCDGFFHKGKSVAVIGSGNTAFDDALYLSDIAEKVYLVSPGKNFTALDVFVKRAEEKANIEFRAPYTAESISGDGLVDSLTVKSKDTGAEEVLSVTGVFIAAGAAGNSAVKPDGVKTDDKGFIIADESCATGVPGVYAAGDIRKKALRQIVTATADGANAVTSALEYLNGR